MYLKQRIFRLNLFMMLFSLLAMVGVSVFVFQRVLLPEDSPAVSSQMIFELQKEFNALEAADFEKLGQSVQQVGGRFYVLSNGQVHYASASDGEDVEDVREWAASPQTEVWQEGDELVIARQLETQGTVYQVFAVFEDWGERSELSRLKTLVVQFGVLAGVALCLILGLNTWFTRRILWAINQPLAHLQEGVQRIETGDYRTPIDYKGDHEFQTVIDGFNTMQSSLEVSREQAKRYEQNRTQMVADISHDLRTPLTSIKGYAKGLLDGVAHSPEKQKQYSHIIYQKSQLMEGLLEKLFLFSQLETDKLPFHLEQVDLAAFLEAYLAEKRVELGGLVAFETAFQGSFPAALDVLQMRRVLDNLVDNAVKYAAVTSLVMAFSIEETERELVLTIADNGKGLPPEEMKLIFKEFYRVDQARQKEGSGLGLSIVEQIVKRHGGRIGVANKAGLEFTIYLPKEKR